jgi:predicted TPR repeat methyltransferase
MASPLLYQNPDNATYSGTDDFLIYNSKTAKLHRLNGSAALLYALCDGGNSADEIVEMLGEFEQHDFTASKKWIALAIKEQLLVRDRPRRHHELQNASQHALHFSAQAEKLRDQGLILAAFVCQYEATRSRPQDARSWMILGELAHILGNRTGAKEAYQRYLELEPGNAEVQHLLQALENRQAPPRAPDECIVQLYARFSEFYEDNMCDDLEYEAPLRIREQLERLSRSEAELNTLELGCGTGLAGRVLRPYAGHLTGVDLSPDMITRCAKHEGLYDELHVTEITSFLARQIDIDKSYDLVVACDTLIYFGDLGQVIEPVSKLLKEHGLLLFTTEKGDMLPFKLTDSGRYSHTESHIRAIAARANLKVVNLEEGFLRYEYGEPVTGLVAALEK